MPLLPVGCCEEFAPSPILIVELLPAYLVGTAPNRIFELIYRSEQVSLITERRCSFDVDSFSGLPNSRSDDFLDSAGTSRSSTSNFLSKEIGLASDRKFFLGNTLRTSFSSTSKGEEPHSLIDSETGLLSHSRKHWPLSLLLLSFEIKLSVKRVQLVLVLASQTKQILVEERTAWLTSEDAQVRTFYYEYRNSTSCAYWYKWVNSLPKSFLSHNHTFFSVASSFWACSPNLLGDLLKSRRRK